MAATAPAAPADDDTRIPVTILTGFLGSGKTTLLNHILTQDHGKKIAIIENEFGEVGIDDALLRKNTKLQAEEEIIEMMNGCICCTVRQDLIVVLKKLADRVAAGTVVNQVVIETTGLADPAPVAQTFFVDDIVKAAFRLDGIVTLIDAKHVEQHLDEEKPEGVENEAVEQVAFADRMLLNKTDLVTHADLKRVTDRLRGINAFAPIFQTCQSRIDVNSVLDIRGFDLDRILAAEPDFLDDEGHEHEHDHSVGSLSIQAEGDVDLDAIQAWMGDTLRTKGADIFRMKGVIAIRDSDEKFVFQGVHMIFNGEFDEKWGADEKRSSNLVFIGRNLQKEELKKSFMECIWSEEKQRAKVEALRFAVGQRVEANAAGGWSPGTVVKLLYRGPGMPAGFVAPYQIKLDNGSLIYAPVDDDRVVKAATA
eukprot:g582.t1